MPSDPCQCDLAGFCERFNRTMDAHQHASCRDNRGGYREYLEATKAGLPWEPTAAAVEIPIEGPGTELSAIFSSLGITELDGCQCGARIIQMNIWGVSGCREHFEEIVGWMRDGAAKFSWVDRIKAAAKAAVSGLAFQISWADPFPDLLRLAIERAEAKAA